MPKRRTETREGVVFRWFCTFLPLGMLAILAQQPFSIQSAFIVAGGFLFAALMTDRTDMGVLAEISAQVIVAKKPERPALTKGDEK